MHKQLIAELDAAIEILARIRAIADEIERLEHIDNEGRPIKPSSLPLRLLKNIAW